MEIKVLGPLTAQEHGISVVPSAAKPRQILAVLAFQAGRIVTVSTLMEEIWGEAIPRSAATTLQTYILQLRRMITGALSDNATRGAKDILVTQHGGYLLDLPPGHVDVQEYEQCASAGRAAFDAHDDRAASHLLGAALDMWRGPALVDVRVGRVLELDVLRIDQDRLAVLERRLTADLRLARHSELVPELTVLTARYPMHENFCALLMLASYRSGNAWRALQAFQQLRSTLIEELGLEPSPRLQRLHQSILTGDPTLDLHAAAL
ncbi:AfsR/SARP family transcriptional regulator [Streptomyces beigongshangae]|uniref:AfsR/SARP family transcriptional regulator n=1 Tax=Streptomyces beigongshangae TaxID=2841597 RepID=UPI001C8410A1|nr:AfsR/SARP family transcriptional regulator [Streptomyces sp. REN17]